MNQYEKRNRLALRAGEVFGPEEAETLMDGLSVGDRLEMDLARFRAEMDQKFAKVDERFVALERSMLESEKRMHATIAREAASTRRFVLTTSLSAASLVLAVMIPMFIAVLLSN